MTASDTDTHYRKQTIPEDGQWARVGHPLPTPSGRVESLAQLHSQRLASRGAALPKGWRPQTRLCCHWECNCSALMLEGVAV